jgi:hypothetical protein
MLFIAAPLSASAQNYSPKKLTHAEQRSCIAKGGQVTIMGLLRDEGCLIQMPDGGKPCVDGSQCRSGGCYIDERKPSFKSPRQGQKAIGICSYTNSGFGCGQRVQNGKAGIAICID